MLNVHSILFVFLYPYLNSGALEMEALISVFIKSGFSKCCMLLHFSHYEIYQDSCLSDQYMQVFEIIPVE